MICSVTSSSTPTSIPTSHVEHCWVGCRKRSLLSFVSATSPFSSASSALKGHWLAPVMSVDVHVPSAEVARPDPPGRLALPEAHSDVHGVRDHRPVCRLLVVVAGAAALGHPHVAQEDVDATHVHGDTRAAHGGEDAAPVRVAAVQSGLHER